MLREMTRPEFADVYALMELSFPPDERRPYAAQRALLDRPGYRIYVPADGPYALLAVWETPEFLFLEHFAVSPKRRGAGLGAALLAAYLLIGYFCMTRRFDAAPRLAPAASPDPCKVSSPW